MTILDTLLEIEKSLLGVAADVAETASDALAAAVRTAAAGVHEVIDTIGGVVKGDE